MANSMFPSNNYGQTPQPMQPMAPAYSQPYPYGQPQMPQVQQNQVQPQPQKSMLNGRMINNENEITDQEIPMDGSVVYFPKSDYSCIFARVRNNGVISSFKFVPEPSGYSNDKNDDILNVLSDMNDKFDSVLKCLRTHKKPQYNKNYNKGE